MSRFIPSPALAVGLVALFVALGGSGYAATKVLPTAHAAKAKKPLRGKTGKTGKPGKTGPAGPAGAPGVAGPAGAPGVKGADGTAGAMGQRGATGATGATGQNAAANAAVFTQTIDKTVPAANAATPTTVQSTNYAGRGLVRASVNLLAGTAGVREECTLNDGATVLADTREDANYTTTVTKQSTLVMLGAVSTDATHALTVKCSVVDATAAGSQFTASGATIQISAADLVAVSTSNP